MKRIILGILAFLLCLGSCQAQTGETLRKKLKDTEVKGDWNYDDLEAGFARARQTGKPLLVVFRCVP